MEAIFSIPNHGMGMLPLRNGKKSIKSLVCDLRCPRKIQEFFIFRNGIFPFFEEGLNMGFA